MQIALIQHAAVSWLHSAVPKLLAIKPADLMHWYQAECLHRYDCNQCHRHFCFFFRSQTLQNICPFSTWWVLASVADERFGDSPLRWIQEPSVVIDRDGRPPRGPPGSALLLCV